MNVGRYLRGEDRHVGTARTTQFQQPQRTWVELTNKEIKDLCEANDWDTSWQSLRFARAIEAKLKEKNT